MCGICGKLNFDAQAPVEQAVLQKMMAAIRHRGPDDDGMYLSGPIGLGFRRLSIIDLNTGHQPISNEDGTIWIIFNGEIYNYQELRPGLLARGHKLKTQTDTEVIVHLYEEMGPRCLEKLRGMFAFALWDARQQTLFLARDRVGIKPLYYSCDQHSLVFGSEMKAILADPDVRREINPEIIARFLTFYYLPGEETLFQSIHKLPPGHYLLAREGRTEVRQYWDLHFSEPDPPMDLDTAKQKLVHLLEEAVQQHMIADVPVGFLLSGGVDSTAVLSFAVGKTDKPISSFTVGFASPDVADERPYARLAAKTFGTQHFDITISPDDFRDFLPRFVWHMEEPVCEPPAVALYYISKLASQYVKVLISGEGGDEAFAGYSNYRNLVWLERLKLLLGPFRRLTSESLITMNRLIHSRIIEKYAPLLDVPLSRYYYSRTSNPFRFFNRNAEKLYTRDFARHVSKAGSADPTAKYFVNGMPSDRLARMLYVDTKTWLPDDLLVKADKMTMANSVELRVPFLDHVLLEFAASLPSDFKLRWFTTKFLAKAALEERVPKPILKRKKAGFPVPYEKWMRADLRGWVSDVLLDRRTRERGYFEPGVVENLLVEDRRTGDYPKEIFSLVVLELWHRVFLDQDVRVQ
jgi:asparagine synthase (glutamine-hydrolysing)